MKWNLSILFLCISLPGIAQDNWYHFAEEFYFVKEVPATQWRGKNFRYEIAVKSKPSDNLSKVRIHGTAVGKGKDDFLSGTFETETRTEQEWTIYTIAGTVRPEAYKLWFYAAVNGNGDFYFDDVSFYIEDQPGHWIQVKLNNPSFEKEGPDIFLGYYVSTRKSRNTRTRITKEIFKTGRQSLWVSSQGQTPGGNIGSYTLQH